MNTDARRPGHLRLDRLLSGDQEAELLKLCLAVTEVAAQAPADWCGEQREFHLPRIQTAYKAVLALFPTVAFRAMGQARGPSGRTLVANDDPRASACIGG